MDLKTLSTFLALVVPFFFATIWALVDSIQKEFGSPGRKVLWVVVAGVPFVGFIVYLLFGFRQGRKPA
ncbi:MAG: PLDc N-terminal domain-containing protein [Desulfobacterales bacterium]|jgi:hypothetical protein|nr:PLDc N-terminal domain-containing protein [Desulfobacteraceae bacterium]MDD3991063.1 PLDc N-terminal domain-containing protein [Desulfobacteraceae bacterium]MDY0311741.1 PLDc N-terminal domain-containing protein [Desulfobacterales bacterium]